MEAQERYTGGNYKAPNQVDGKKVKCFHRDLIELNKVFDQRKLSETDKRNTNTPGKVQLWRCLWRRLWIILGNTTRHKILLGSLGEKYQEKILKLLRAQELGGLKKGGWKE